MKSISKKGQLSTLTPSIIALVVTVIILVVGILIVQNVTTLTIVGAGESGSGTNQSVTTVNQVGDILVSVPNCVATVSVAINGTSGTVIPASNYTISGCTLFANRGPFNDTTWNVSYTFTQGGQSFIASNNSLVGLAEFGDFIPLIVIAVIASIIIGLILTSFVMRRER